MENIGEKENDDSISIDSVETINSQYEINYNNENESIAPSQNCHPILIDQVLIDINVYYSPGEIEPLGTMHFPELENLPSNKISVREAARLQSTGPVTGAICNCKGNCDNSRCRCKKVGKNCGSRCHNGHSCQNKEN